MSNGTHRTGGMPTTAQLKEGIDRGSAGDKVDFPDPAASPLGTDAEAGGVAPTPTEVASAYKQEIQGKADGNMRRDIFIFKVFDWNIHISCFNFFSHAIPPIFLKVAFCFL